MDHRNSLAFDFLQVFPSLCPSLLGEPHRAQLLAFSSGLPSMDGGFETTLDGDGPPADLALRCTSGEMAASVLADADPTVRLSPTLAADPVWRKAAAALPHLAADGHVWFEYDHVDILRDRPVANLIIVNGTKQGGAPVMAGRMDFDLVGDDLPPTSLDFVRQLLASLPAHATVEEFGVMEARAGRPLRLRLAQLSPADVDAMATGFGWKSTERMRPLLKGLAALYPALTVVVDIVDGRLERFGVTMPSVQYPNASDYMPDTIARLSWLLMQGLCSPVAARGLRTWLGWAEDARSPADYPYRIDAKAEPDLIGALVRVLVQFKLAFGADGQVKAKAYFGFLRRRSRRKMVGAPPIGPRWSDVGQAH